MATENVVISGSRQQDLIHKTNDAREGKRRKKIKKWRKISLFILQTLVIGVLMALNYLYRYNYTTRFKSDMVDYYKGIMSCDVSTLKYQFSWPYYNYYTYPTKSLEGLLLLYELPEWVFYSCVLLIPILTFCFVEGMRAAFTKSHQKAIVIWGLTIPLLIRRLLRTIGAFLFGASLAGLFVAVWKLNIASPRPHFMSVCFYDLASPHPCNTDAVSWSPLLECLNNNQEQIVEALKSFPSYHAALAVYMGVFTSAYTILNTQVRGIYGPSFLFIFGLMVMAMIGATHRLASGYSFPRDIIWGGFVGFVIAYFTATVLLNRFRGNIKRKRKFTRKKSERVSRDHGATILAEKNQSNDESDTDFTSDSSDDEYNEAAKIDCISLIPRARMDSSNRQPIQAVNPTYTNDERKSTFTSSLKSLPQRNLASFAPGQSSSLGRELSERPYNVPRQRNSSPWDEAGNSATGYNNYGFESSHTKSRPIHTVYEARRDMENTSRF